MRFDHCTNSEALCTREIGLVADLSARAPTLGKQLISSHSQCSQSNYDHGSFSLSGEYA